MFKGKYFIYMMIISISGSGIYYLNTQNDRNFNSSMRNFSVKEQAKKNMHFTGNLNTALINKKMPKDKIIVKTKVNLIVKDMVASYNEAFTKEQEVLADNLNGLEDKHYHLLNNLRNEGVKIDPITNLKPRLKIAISYYLDLKPYELTVADLNSLHLDNQSWYQLKTFSESKDFEIYLKRGTLSSEVFPIN